MVSRERTSGKEVVLVDIHDNPVGTAEKLAAHEDGGQLHRAFSVFIFDSQGQMLIHKRAADKYHSGGLWTNACCSHPGSEQEVRQAAEKRLREEMGLDCALTKVLEFVYQETLEGGLTEHEYDHVYVGTCDEDPVPDPEEVSDWAWVKVNRLRRDIEQHPERYTAWFRIVFERAVAAYDRHVRGGAQRCENSS